MTLLDAPAETPHKSRAVPFTIAAVVLIVVVGLWLMLRYYPEKKAAERFFNALVAGDTNTAYQLWKASPSYEMKDFLADWGPNGYYGPVKSYEIKGAKMPRGSNAVAVTVDISPYSPMPDSSDVEKSRKTRPVEVWILPEDKSFSFPP